QTTLSHLYRGSLLTVSNRRSSPPSAPNPFDERQERLTSSRTTTSRMIRLLLLGGALLLLLWLGLKTWRVYGAAQSLMSVEQEARELMAGGVSTVEPDAAESLVLGAREDIVTLYQELGFIRPIAPYLGWVPRLGPTLVASPHLLDMADAGSEAGALAVSSLKPALGVIQQESFSAARMGELLPILAAAAPDL